MQLTPFSKKPNSPITNATRKGSNRKLKSKKKNPQKTPQVVFSEQVATPLLLFTN